MTIKTRRALFYGLFVFFIIAGASIVLYSQGWRMNVDIENCKIERLKDCRISFQKTGAIYVETEPKGVIIEIGDKAFPDRSNIIKKGTLILNLLPITYKLKIIKDGYRPYYKNLAVKSSLVSELLDVILIPEKPNKNAVVVPKIRGDALVDISGDNKKFIVKDSAAGIYRLYDLDNLSSTLNLTAAFNNLKKESMNKIVFLPFDANKFIAETKNGLYILDTKRLKLKTAVQPLPLAWTVKNPNIYYVKSVNCQLLNVKCRNLTSFNLVVKTETDLVKLPADTGQITELGVSDSQNKIALLNNLGDLFIFNQSDKNFQKIAHNAKKFVFSPDDKKIAFMDSDGKITVHFLEDYRKNLDKKAGDVVRLNLDNKKSIKRIYWHKDSNHLFVEYPEKTIFTEIDDRPPLNSYTVAEGVEKLFYNINDNLLYLIRRNSLVSFGLEK